MEKREGKKSKSSRWSGKAVARDRFRKDGTARRFCTPDSISFPLSVSDIFSPILTDLWIFIPSLLLYKMVKKISRERGFIPKIGRKDIFFFPSPFFTWATVSRPSWSFSQAASASDSNVSSVAHETFMMADGRGKARWNYKRSSPRPGPVYFALHRGYFHFNWRLLNPVPPLYFSLLRRGCNPSTSTEEKKKKKIAVHRVIVAQKAKLTILRRLSSFSFFFFTRRRIKRGSKGSINVASYAKR